MSNAIVENLERAFTALPAEGYAEPPSTAVLREMSKQIDLEGGNWHAVAMRAIERVATLEAALAPFAVHGATMIQLRAGASPPFADNTAGGVWFNEGETDVLVEAEGEFVAAVDALGRAATLALVRRDVAAHRAMAERDKAQATKH